MAPQRVISENTRVRWDQSGADAAEDLANAPLRRERLLSLCVYAVQGELRYAALWQPSDDAPELRFAPDIALARADAVLARSAREGFHPILVTMSGSPERPLLAFALERTPQGRPPSTFLPPRPFGDASLKQGPGVVRCVAAVGAPPSGLLIAAIRAPSPPVHVASAIHLEQLDPSRPFRDQPLSRALEAAARPVQAIPLRGDGGAPWVLSLWHDDAMEPWPAPDPFMPARRFEADEAIGAPAVACAIERRRAEERRSVIALGAGPDSRFIALYGSIGRSAPLRRRFVAVPAGIEPPATIVAEGAEGDEAPANPLDAWALSHMRATGARHGQIVVVRGPRLVHAAAYTLAEPGYPVARLDHALRLGSVSKALTATALLLSHEKAALPKGLDTPIADPALLDLPAGRGAPQAQRVTLRHLLTHRSGLRTFFDIRPDEPENALSERALTSLLDGAPGPARPGMIAAALAALCDDRPFAAPPGREDYSNEGFIVLGEILGRLVHGRLDAYERAIVDVLLRPAGVDPGDRGCLLGAGRASSLARGESPAHPACPAVAENRLGEDGERGALVLAPYALNGPFLGGAAGWSVPLVWVAQALAALLSGSWMAAQASIAAEAAAPGSTMGHGFRLGKPGFWTFYEGAGAPRTIRVRRLFHAGRVEGGASLLEILAPLDPSDEPALGLGVVAAFNQLGPLFDEPHGRALLGILRAMEATNAFDDLDMFPLVAKRPS